MTVQIFVYKFLFTIVYFGKKKDSTHETFHILEMNAHSDHQTVKQSSHHIMLKFVGFHLCTQYLALWIKKEQSQIWTKALLFQEVALTEIYNKKHPQIHFKGFGFENYD